jgi:hypothetical protein
MLHQVNAEVGGGVIKIGRYFAIYLGRRSGWRSSGARRSCLIRDHFIYPRNLPVKLDRFSDGHIFCSSLNL